MGWCLVGAASMCLMLALAAGAVRWRHVDLRGVRPFALIRGCAVSVLLGGALVLGGLGVALVLWQVYP